MKNTLAVVPPSDPAPESGALTLPAVLGQVALIQQIMGAAMKDGEHFGKIPGCGDKPTLLKPGAEKLCLTFRLAPSYNVEERDLGGGHREYRVTASLASILSGQFVGQGLGTCSTMEAKYRYRGKAGRKCPQCNAPAIIKGKAEYGGGWVCFAKKGGCGAKFRDGDKSIEDQSEKREENPDLADTWNTCLKMGKKRALVDAVLTATAASDIFAQDLEEISEHIAAHQSPDPAPQQPALAPQAAAPVQAEREHPWDTLRSLMGRDGISERELVNDLTARVTRAGHSVMHPDEDLPNLPANRLAGIVAAWEKIAAAVLAARKS